MIDTRITNFVRRLKLFKELTQVELDRAGRANLLQLAAFMKTLKTPLFATKLKYRPKIRSKMTFFFLLASWYGIAGHAIQSKAPIYAVNDITTDFQIVRIASPQANGEVKNPCSALVLNRSALLTAAHCVADLVGPKKIVIEYPEDDKLERHDIKEFLRQPNPNYVLGQTTKLSETGADLVGILLEKQLGREVRIVREADFAGENPRTSRSAFYIVGAGVNEFKQFNAAPGARKQVLEFVSLLAPETDFIEKGFSNFVRLQIPPAQEPQQAICIADSGSPIFIENDGVVQIYAVLSSLLVRNKNQEFCGGKIIAPLTSLNLVWISALIKSSVAAK